MKNKKSGNFHKWVREQVNIINSEMMFGLMYYNIKHINKTSAIDWGVDYNLKDIFCINPDLVYRKTVILVYPRASQMFEAGARDVLTDSLIHELTHIHTAPLFDLAVDRFATRKQILDATETLTETMAEYIRMNIKNDKKNNIYEE